MNPLRRRIQPCRSGVAILAAACILAACGDGGAPPANEAAAPVASAKPTAAKPEISPVDACSLLTAAEVKAVAGRTTMEPVEDHSIERMSICVYGEPDSPMLAGTPLAKVAQLSVLTGGNGYFEGPAAQVNASFDMITSNAGDVQPISGLGERSHWAANLDTLRVVQGHYLLEVEVAERDKNGDKINGDPLQIAQQIAKTALDRLP